MLIQSPRVTKADLALWHEYFEADLVHGRTLDEKIEKAIADIRDFATKPCYGSVSWGKDSTVLAHLLAISGYRIPLVWVKVEPIANPDCAFVRDRFNFRWQPTYTEIVVRCRKDESGYHASGTLEAGFRTAEGEFGHRKITGIRADESTERWLARHTHGAMTEGNCKPLSDWTVQDVFGYLARFDLPIHPVYAMLGGGRYDREWLRVASLGGRRGDGHGRAEWEKEYYGDVLARMQINGSGASR